LFFVRVFTVFSGRDIEIPGVPRAGNHIAVQLALAQWTALVRAHIVQGVEAAIDIEDGYLLIVDLKTPALAFGDVTR